jgi:hypothetical protein
MARSAVPGGHRCCSPVVRGRPLSGILAAVCVTAALSLGATPALAASASTTAAAATTPASSGVSAPSFGLGNAQENESTSATTSTTPATTATTSTTSTGLSGSDGIVIGVIVIGLLVGIAVFVVRDARTHTVGDPDVSDDPFASKRKGSKAPPKSRKLKPAERKRRKRSRAPRKRW